MDVKNVFLNGDLEEHVYMYQPQGFQVPRKEHLVCNLKKALDSLKQEPRVWYIKIDTYLDEQGFQHSPSYSIRYVKSIRNDNILLVIHVDESLL